MGLRQLTRASRLPVPFTPRNEVAGVPRNGWEAVEGPSIPHGPRITQDYLEAAGGMGATQPLSIPVFWDCLNLVSETIATLALDTFKLDENGEVSDRIYPTPPVIHNPFPPWNRNRWVGFIMRCLSSCMRQSAFASSGTSIPTVTRARPRRSTPSG